MAMRISHNPEAWRQFSAQGVGQMELVGREKTGHAGSGVPGVDSGLVCTGERGECAPKLDEAIDPPAIGPRKDAGAGIPVEQPLITRVVGDADVHGRSPQARCHRPLTARSRCRG